MSRRLPEFMTGLREHQGRFRPKQQQDFIWDKIIYANPTKPKETLLELDQYKPLVTYDNLNELKKIQQYAPHAGRGVAVARCQYRLAWCELSIKFGCDPGEAVDLILAAFKHGPGGGGAELPRGQPVHEFRKFRPGVEHRRGGDARIQIARARNQDSRYRRRFSRALRRARQSRSASSRERSTPKSTRLFPEDIQILAEPGRFLVATAATSVARIIGKAVRDGKTLLLHR